MPLGKTADFVLPFWQLQFLKFLGLMQLNAIKCKGLKQWKVYNVYKLCFHLVQSIQPSLPHWLAKLARLSCWCALVSAWWSQSRSKKWLQWFHQKIMPIPGSPQLFHHFHVAFICFYVVCYFTVVTIRSGCPSCHDQRTRPGSNSRRQRPVVRKFSGSSWQVGPFRSDHWNAIRIN